MKFVSPATQAGEELQRTLKKLMPRWYSIIMLIVVSLGTVAAIISAIFGYLVWSNVPNNTTKEGSAYHRQSVERG